MRHHIDSTPVGARQRAAAVARLGALVLVAAGGWSLYLAAATPLPASASTLGGTATITDPSLTPLPSGGSTTVFSVVLPANAACTGDTATGGYHVFSYLVEQGTDVTTVTFTTHPSVGIGLVNNTGVYYGPVNTAITTGQIISIPTNFEWAPLVSNGTPVSSLLYGGSTGVWEAGLACADSSGTLSDYWNTEVTFSSSTSDPNGFVWSAVPGPPGSTTTTTTSGATTTTTTSPGGATTTTTTTPGSTTTTLGTGATTTTSVAGSTVSGASPTTTSAAGAVTGATGGGAATPASSSSLALTGGPERRDAAVGMLCIGTGLVLLGASARMRRARPHPDGYGR